MRIDTTNIVYDSIEFSGNRERFEVDVVYFKGGNHNDNGFVDEVQNLKKIISDIGEFVLSHEGNYRDKIHSQISEVNVDI